MMMMIITTRNGGVFFFVKKNVFVRRWEKEDINGEIRVIMSLWRLKRGFFVLILYPEY
jgi:hypothetical protein